MQSADSEGDEVDLGTPVRWWSVKRFFPGGASIRIARGKRVLTSPGCYEPTYTITLHSPSLEDSEAVFYDPYFAWSAFANCSEIFRESYCAGGGSLRVVGVASPDPML